MSLDTQARRLAVFASGRGSNFEALLKASREDSCPCRPVCVLSDRQRAPVLDLARRAGLEARAFGPACWRQENPACEPVIRWLKEQHVELIALAGFLKRVPEAILAAWPERILNIHPALLPRFGGAGMYGEHVHRAVHEAGDTVSGATVHLVNRNYDEGRILAAVQVDIADCTGPEEIAARVLEVEHRLYPEALARFCRNEFQNLKRTTIDADS